MGGARRVGGGLRGGKVYKHVSLLRVWDPPTGEVTFAMAGGWREVLVGSTGHRLLFRQTL